MRRIGRLGIGALLTAAAFGAGCAHRAPGTPPAATAGNIDATGKTLAQLFEGRAGVAVTSLNGGAAVKLRIRNARNADGTDGDPLFVIDGLPTNPPNGVFIFNPMDILRIEILKDDASTLVWGDRATHGVVKITTKRK